MLSVEEALRLALEHTEPRPPIWCTSLADAYGCVLAESVASDIDSPPYDKSVVDGYAVISADVQARGVELRVLEEVTAGVVPTRTVEPGTATRIMTGAPLPAGADSVVMVEQTETVGDRVRILKTNVKPGQNIMRRATSLARGEEILQPGTLLRPIEIGLLAEGGRKTVCVVPKPQVGVVVTGNELVEAGEAPAPGRIRNSNGPMLTALALAAGAQGENLGVARDNEESLQSAINAGLLSRDIVVISGGVSAGILDLVPGTLQRLGVKQV